MMKRQFRTQSGFTLIEVMVVVAILGLLAAMVVPNLIGRDEEARIAKAKQDISSLENSLDLYRLDNFTYPTVDQGLDALVKKPSGSPEPKHYKEGGYIKKLPTDPWGNAYQYLKPGTHGAIDVYSLGADQIPSDDDIGSWNLDK